MDRTQIYLPSGHLRRLQREARRAGISFTELVRRIVADHLAGRHGVKVFKKEEVLSFVALGRSGKDDVSERHDAALDEAYRAGHLR